MNDLADLIKERLTGPQTPQEYAQVIVDLGFELMDSGQLDSDEQIWEVARNLWKTQEKDYEKKVVDEFHKLMR